MRDLIDLISQNIKLKVQVGFVLAEFCHSKIKDKVLLFDMVLWYKLSRDLWYVS